jgi:hypothetical protein
MTRMLSGRQLSFPFAVGQLVESLGKALSCAPVVDEDHGAGVFLDQL